MNNEDPRYTLREDVAEWLKLQDLNPKKNPLTPEQEAIIEADVARVMENCRKRQLNNIRAQRFIKHNPEPGIRICPTPGEQFNNGQDAIEEV